MKSLSHLVEFRSNSCVLGQYYSMSSSTHPSGVNQTDAIIASDKASGFKRWSRNLSSQRHRELDRLNQIEQHRQFLELKKQNDLFVQMSVTVTGTRNDPRQVDSGIAESSSNKRSSKVFSEVNCSDQTENRVITDTVEVGSSKLRAPKPNKINLCHEVENVNCEKIGVESNVATITHKRRNAGKRILSRENQSNSKQTDPSAKRHMTTEQLERFVSACVPANKRVLCLIVRDKMSRLNKAKSYFYPTYYLFIQAIVDIDSNGYERTFSATSEEDLVNEDILRNASADGSFSASSSISADMMFIGSSNNETRSRKFGNSYSDNEVCGDTETEDDYRNVEKGLQLASEINEGRHSPLVYPNTDVNVATDFYNTDSKSLQMRKELNQDDCNKLKRNNIGTLNADLSKLTDQQVKTKVKLSNEDSYDDDEDSDNDDLNYGQNELTDEDYGNEAGENAKINKYEENLEEVILFDEDENPYTGTYGILLTGRRRKKAKTLSHAENNNNDRCTIASISYETNVLGFKGPRKMRVFLAKNPSGGIKNLPELFKKNSAAVTQLKNMTPSWNVESQSYVLNFHGRVTQASVKNFQLIECTADQPSSALEGQVRQQITLFQTGDSKQKQQLPQLNLVNKSATQALQMTNKERSQTGRFASNLTSQSHHQPQQSHFTTKRPTESGESDEPRRPAFDEEKEGSADMRALNSTSMFLTDDNEASVSSVTCGYGGEIGGVRLDKNAPLMDNKNSTYNSSIVMQFGRISNHEFTCDVTHPLSILQAFAIALNPLWPYCLDSHKVLRTDFAYANMCTSFLASQIFYELN